MSEIKLVRIITGESIVAEISYKLEGKNDVVLKNPCTLGLLRSPNDPNSVNVQLRPWEPFTEEREIEISSDKIIYTVSPVQDLLNNYNQIFGSGLVVAPAGTIPKKPSNLSVIK